jgi:hypothetical protein
VEKRTPTFEEMVRMRVVLRADGRHGFDILDDDSRSRQVMQRTLTFLRDQLLSRESVAGSVPAR